MSAPALVRPFVFQATLPKVIFGEGALAELPDEIERLGVGRALVVSTANQIRFAERLQGLLGARCAGIYPHAATHVPWEIAKSAIESAAALRADAIVAFGGGSATGLAKAIARDSGLPIVSIPTTYAGSEMTPIFGITTANQKQTGRDPRVLPKVAIYDPTLSRELPLEISIASGLNAMAHAVEGLYAQDGNPIASLMAEEAIGALALGMQTISRRRDDLAGRSQCLYGAWLSGVVLGNVGMALHHKLCHTLGGTFNLAHAQTHAVILPHAFAFNETAAPEASRRVRRALGDAGPSGAQALHRLEVALGAPLSLQALGLRASDLDRAAESAIQSPYPNPRAVEKTAVRALLDDAFFGRRPRDW